MVSLSICHVHITVLVLVHEQTCHADRTRAEKVYQAGGQNGELTLVKQTGLWKSNIIRAHPAGPRAIWFAAQNVQKRNKSSSGLWGTSGCGSRLASNWWSKDVTGSYSLHLNCCLKQPLLGVVVSSRSSSSGSSGGAAGGDGCINNNSTSSVLFYFSLLKATRQIWNDFHKRKHSTSVLFTTRTSINLQDLPIRNTTVITWDNPALDSVSNLRIF